VGPAAILALGLALHPLPAPRRAASGETAIRPEVKGGPGATPTTPTRLAADPPAAKELRLLFGLADWTLGRFRGAARTRLARNCNMRPPACASRSLAAEAIIIVDGLRTWPVLSCRSPRACPAMHQDRPGRGGDLPAKRGVGGLGDRLFGGLNWAAGWGRPPRVAAGWRVCSRARGRGARRAARSGWCAQPKGLPGSRDPVPQTCSFALFPAARRCSRGFDLMIPAGNLARQSVGHERRRQDQRFAKLLCRLYEPSERRHRKSTASTLRDFDVGPHGGSRHRPRSFRTSPAFRPPLSRQCRRRGGPGAAPPDDWRAE